MADNSNPGEIPAELSEAPQSKWPGVDLAYDIAVASYPLAYQRLDNINARIQSLLTYTATVTLGAPVVVTSIDENADFGSWWFVVAIALFLANAVAGTFTIMRGTVVAVTPRLLHAKWLAYEPDQFKERAIYWAGEHFECNKRLVNRKGRVAVAMTLVFLAEAISLLIWAASET